MCWQVYVFDKLNFMITLNDFFNTEGSIIFTTNILLNTIERLRHNDIGEESLSFNIYKVSINQNLNEVIISNDIFDDNERFLKMSIDDFYTKLTQNKKENN